MQRGTGHCIIEWPCWWHAEQVVGGKVYTLSGILVLFGVDIGVVWWSDVFGDYERVMYDG